MFLILFLLVLAFSKNFSCWLSLTHIITYTFKAPVTSIDDLLHKILELLINLDTYSTMVCVLTTYIIGNA